MYDGANFAIRRKNDSLTSPLLMMSTQTYGKWQVDLWQGFRSAQQRNTTNEPLVPPLLHTWNRSGSSLPFSVLDQLRAVVSLCSKRKPNYSDSLAIDCRFHVLDTGMFSKHEFESAPDKWVIDRCQLSIPASLQELLQKSSAKQDLYFGYIERSWWCQLVLIACLCHVWWGEVWLYFGKEFTRLRVNLIFGKVCWWAVWWVTISHGSVSTWLLNLGEQEVQRGLIHVYMFTFYALSLRKHIDSNLKGWLLTQIWLQLKTAYVSKESLVLGRGELVWDARKVALHYLVPLTGFLFDVYIILPVPQVWIHATTSDINFLLYQR